jgi:hypothetical protein
MNNMADKLENEIKINPDNQAPIESSPETSEANFQSAPAPAEQAVTEAPPEPAPAIPRTDIASPEVLQPTATNEIVVEQSDSELAEEMIQDSKKLDEGDHAKRLVDLLP